jgi:tetratricopeptide (TPR) repeat protein
MNFLPGFFACTVALFLLRAPYQDKRGHLPRLPQELEFYDQPTFIVAGVTDGGNGGGHGSDTILRSSEALAKATASLGSVNAHPEDLLQAARAYQRAAEKDPSEPNLFDWGTELLAHRASGPAAEVFTRGTRLFPRSMRMLLGLAVSQYANGSYEPASRSFFAAADLNPSDPKPYLFLAKVQGSIITESDGYRDRMARFASVAPDSAWANFYYAVSLRDRDIAKTKTLLYQALQLDPKLAEAHVQLGIIYASGKNFEPAIAAFQKAIAIDPKLEEAHYRLAQAYAQTGDKGKAQKEFQIHDHLLKESAAQVEQERRQVQQFVIELRGPDRR